MSVAQMDAAKQEAFAGRMIGVVNDTCLGLMAGLGHETGLFDTMAGMAPATSAAIAQSAGLNERYVREWLGAMVTGGIVEYEPARATYALPPEHAASLTRAAGPDNLARIAQDFGMMGEVEQQVADAFRTGAGVPYSAYPRFQALQAEESGEVFDLALAEGIIPLVPGLPERLRKGVDALDIGTGQGHAVNVLAKAGFRCLGHPGERPVQGLRRAAGPVPRRGLVPGQAGDGGRRGRVDRRG